MTENVELGPKPLWARPGLWYAGAAPALGGEKRKRISRAVAKVQGPAPMRDSGARAVDWASSPQGALYERTEGPELALGETQQAGETRRKSQ